MSSRITAPLTASYFAEVINPNPPTVADIIMIIIGLTGLYLAWRSGR